MIYKINSLNIKTLFIIIVFVINGIGYVGAYLEDKVFCIIENDYVSIFLSKDDAYKCKDYVYAIDQSIKIVYKDMLTIHKFINQGEDIDFWFSIMNQKRSELNSLQNARNLIFVNIKLFEEFLFIRIKDIMIGGLINYKNYLYGILEKYNTLDIHSLSGYVVGNAYQHVFDIKNSISMIESIEFTSDLESLISNLKNYLYLKQESGKLEL